MADTKDNLPHDRRAMFRLGLKRLVGPVAQYLQERIEINLPVFRECLRPPGALAEKKFLDTCYRCGNCIDVCPARAIRPISGSNVEQTGTPYIDPDLAACVACDELACMKACPSGALQRLSVATQIQMGLAEVSRPQCVRTQGADCTLCISKCPIGPAAIGLNSAGQVEVNPSGCIGCGACQFFCPTTPKAIVVHPQ